MKRVDSAAITKIKRKNIKKNKIKNKTYRRKKSCGPWTRSFLADSMIMRS